MPNSAPSCLVCHQTAEQIPLIQLLYGESHYYICPSHFPLLIHQPQRLVGVLPGAEHLHPHHHEEE